MVLFSLIILFFIPALAHPQKFPDKEIDSLLNQGIIKLLRQDYQGATGIFAKLEKEFPKLPFGRVYLAATEIAKNIDYGIEFEDNFIKNKLTEAIAISEERLDEEENDIWNNYYMAMSKGYLAYYHALNKDFLEAFAEGYYSISYFERCLQIDQKFYESHIALGTYLYWKSAKAKEWLPFMEGDQKEGIKLLEEAFKYSEYNYHMAANSLIWVYIDKKQYQTAVEISKLVLDKYEGNRYFKWGLARAYEELDKNQSIKVYEEILNSLLAEKKLNDYNEVTLKHKIAQLYDRMGNREKALLFCNEILAIENMSDIDIDRLEERMERVVKLRNKLSLFKEKD